MTSSSGQVGRLKQAAIDAAMRRGEYRADGDSYLSIQLPDYGVVTRPGEDGLGGGIAVRIPAEHPRARLNSSQIAEMKQSATENFTAEFERIRTTIDTIVAPWEELPQGSTIDSVAEKCDTLISNLMGAITESGSAFSGSGELGSAFSRVLMESTSFGGGALDDFKQSFEALSSRIYEEESGLIDMIDETIDRVKDSADKFQLAPAPIYKWEDDVMYAEPRRRT